MFLSYVLSFIYVGIYWNNHHHMLHAAQHVDGSVMWANLHLLFWLSLIPFVTGWMGENHFAALPVALYGVVLLMAAHRLHHPAVAHHRAQGAIAAGRAVGRDLKGKLSLLLYVVGHPVGAAVALDRRGIYVLVALIWLVPDRRIERA